MIFLLESYKEILLSCKLIFVVCFFGLLVCILIGEIFLGFGVNFIILIGVVYVFINVWISVRCLYIEVRLDLRVF